MQGLMQIDLVEADEKNAKQKGQEELPALDEEIGANKTNANDCNGDKNETIEGHAATPAILDEMVRKG
jgi:hypothetical protein